MVAPFVAPLKLGHWLGTADSSEITDTTQAFTSEFVKSYGFRYENRSWSWSLDNIARQFDEHPVWTTVDYLTLGLPLAKWGTSAYKVSSGIGAAGRAYKAGALSEFGEATTRGGRFAERAGRHFGAGEGFGRAVELERTHGVAQTGVGRLFSSYAARRADDPEWQKLVDAAGGRDPNEMRAWGAMLDRDRKAEAAAVMAEAGSLHGRWRGAGVTPTTPQGKAAGDLVHEAMSRGHSRPAAEVQALIGQNVDDTYQASMGFRRKIHDGYNEAGYTSDEVWEAGYDGYMPRVSQELERIKAAFPGSAVSNAGDMAGAARAKHRKWSNSDIENLEREGVYTRILDPGVGMLEIGRAGMALAGHNYVKRLANSAASRTADEVLESVGSVFRGEANDLISQARRAQYTDEQVGAYLDWEALYRTHDRANIGGPGTIASLPDEVKGAMMRKLGWKPIEEVLTGQNMPAHLGKLAEESKGKWIDPAAIEDFAGAGVYGRVMEGLPAWMQKTVAASVATFKFTHTVLNPATQVRNKVGSIVFHHLNVGGLGVFDPQNPMMRKGAKALEAGATGVGDDIAKEDWKDVLRSGLINTGHSAETTRDWERVIGKQITPGQGVGEETFFKLLDWMHVANDSKVRTKPGEFMSWATKRYQYTDDLAKADALLVLRDRYLKALKAEQKDLLSKGSTSRTAQMTADELRNEAVSRAMVEVAKFQPVFSTVSPLTNMLRDAVPFSSFTTEAVRVWKNAIMERPIQAFMYNHMIEATSHVTGAMAGFNEKQLADAEASLPWYMQGKKALTIPFRVDGKPVFVDFSYMIPMANLPETFGAESNFFDWIQVDPFKSHPLLNLGTAIATGTDPFSGREVEPNFTERQLGITMQPGQLRKVVGIAEHAARLLLPPLAPPGQAGVNLLELARGQKNAFTGQELEQGIARTLASNLLGLRSYQGDINSQLQNAKREDAKLDERMGVWWNRWKDSAVNGDPAGMAKAVAEVKALRMLRGDDEAAASKYIANGIKEREPGKFRSLSTREIQATLDRAERLGGQSPADSAMRAELMARLQERTHRTRSKPKAKKAKEKVSGK